MASYIYIVIYLILLTFIRYDMYKTNRKVAQAGFTLVELSIVIVIIGFLVAGIAAGANLVKQAQIRSVISDLNSFQTGYNGFIGKYNAAPGDLSVASTYWPFGATGCADLVGNNVMCDGDGDGNIIASTTATDEVAAAWKHLQLSGFVGAGIAQFTAAVPAALVIGTNVPASKITGSGYMMSASTNLARAGAAVNIGSGAGATNYLYLGKPSATPLNLVAGSLKPEDAFNIDAKMDDGLISGANFSGANSGNFRSVTGNVPVSTCNTAANYTIANAASDCLVGKTLN
jgi:prepilin-type N-terminal cleavage/methylation domain-containing protein